MERSQVSVLLVLASHPSGRALALPLDESLCFLTYQSG